MQRTNVLVVLALLLLVPFGAAQDEDPEDAQEGGQDGASGDASGNSTEGDGSDGNTTDGDDSKGNATDASDGHPSEKGRPAGRGPPNGTGNGSADRGNVTERELAQAYCEQHANETRCQRYQEAKERQAAQKAYCEDHPEAARCSPGRAEADEAARRGAQHQACMQAARGASDVQVRGQYLHACCQGRPADAPEDRRLCDLQDALRSEPLPLRHIAFDFLEDGLGIQNHTVDGRLVLERLEYVPVDPDVEVLTDRRGARVDLRIGDEALVQLQDNPTGLLKFQGDGELHLRLPNGTQVEASEGGLRVLGDDWQGLVVAEELRANGTEIHASGFLSYHIRPARPESAPATEVSQGLERAMEKRHIGAEVSLRGSDQNVSVLAYDDVDVEVELPTDKATRLNPIRVEVSAELEEGRTIVLDLDPELLESTDPADLELHYYDVEYDNGTRRAVEVPFAMASGLEDVMDPTDDDGQAEYWVVSDVDGLHVLVSVPSWSVHAFTISSSVIEVVAQPSVLVGLVAGASGAVIAAVVLLRPRRED